MTGFTNHGPVTTITTPSGESLYTNAALNKGVKPRFVTEEMNITFLMRYYAYTLADGSTLLFNRANSLNTCNLGLGEELTQEWMEANFHCKGWIDVDGINGSMHETVCKTGTTSLDKNEACVVTNDASSIGDFFPIVFHNNIVEPASNAARAVLNGK